MMGSQYELQLEEMGRTLTERAVDVYNMDNVEIVSRWFHSVSDCDLMVWLDGENQLIRFQFNISGQIVDWNKMSGFRTGLIVETECRSESVVSETINFDKVLATRAIFAAQKVLLAARDIRSPWREKMVRLLSSSGNSSKLAASGRESRTRFWSRLKLWVTG